MAGYDKSSQEEPMDTSDGSTIGFEHMMSNDQTISVTCYTTLHSPAQGGLQTQEITKSLTSIFGVVARISTNQITLQGQQSQVNKAIGYLKGFDPNINFYPTYPASLDSVAGNSSSSVNLPSWEFHGEDTAKILKFCSNELKALDDSKCVTVKLFDSVQAPVLKIVVAKNIHYDFVAKEIKEIEKKIDSIKTGYVFVIPEEKLELASQIVKNLNDSSSPCIALLKDRDIKILCDSSSKLEEIKTALKKELVDSQFQTTHTLSHGSSSTSSSFTNNYSHHSVVPSVNRDHQKSTFVTSVGSFHADFRTDEGIKVLIYCQSIVDIKVDAIVNAANEWLQNHAGVARVISVAGGDELERECKSKLSRHGRDLRATETLVTSGGRLINCSNVIHAVGPRWDDYTDKVKCLADLSRTVHNILSTAERLLYKKIAMPCICAGVFGVPKILCAETYTHAIMEYSRKNQFSASTLKEIHIVDLTDTILRDIELAYLKWKRNPKLIDPMSADKNHADLMKFSVHAASHSHDFAYESTSGRKPFNKYQEAEVEKKDTRPSSARPSSAISCKILEIQDSMIGHNIVAKEFEVRGLVNVKIYSGSIVKVSGLSAIVCSADSMFSGAGPLSQAVAKAGGDRYKKSYAAMQKKYPINSPGDVYSCDAGNIGVAYVVHAVMDQLAYTDTHKLQQYKNILLGVLKKTNSWKMKGIAMPLIGAGYVEKNPRDLGLCCNALREAVCEFCCMGQGCSITEIHFVNRNPSITDSLIKNFKEHSTKSPIGASSVRPKTAGSKNRGRHNWDHSTTSQTNSHWSFDQNIGLHDNDSHHGGARPKHKSYSQSFRATGSSTIGSGKPHSSKSSKDDFDLARALQTDKEKKTKTRGNLNIINSGISNPGDSDIGADFHSDMALAMELSRQESLEKSKELTDCSSCKQKSNDVESLPCGHSFCFVCIAPIKDNKKCFICPTSMGFNSSENEESSNEDEGPDCVICMDKVKNGKKLKCGHEFCSDCIANSFKHKPACPTCGTIFGTVYGNQPENGTMKVHKEGFPSLPGYDGSGTIVIKYFFPDGVQRENHPNPGVRYKGAERTAYLPDNREGREVLKLLKVAWDRRLIFTIGSSRTTGEENIVTWNDIHHKTKRFPGAQFGFPDPGYFDRVKDELAAKGVTG